MSNKLKPTPFSHRVRLWVFRFAGGWLLVFGSLGALMGVAGFVISIMEDGQGKYGPWWAQILGVAFCGLFIVVGLKALRLKSVSDIEAEGDMLEHRAGRFLAWLNGRSRAD